MSWLHHVCFTCWCVETSNQRDRQNKQPTTNVMWLAASTLRASVRENLWQSISWIWFCFLFFSQRPQKKGNHLQDEEFGGSLRSGSHGFSGLSAFNASSSPSDWSSLFSRSKFCTTNPLHYKLHRRRKTNSRVKLHKNCQTDTEINILCCREKTGQHLQLLHHFIHEVAGVLLVIQSSLDHLSEHLCGSFRQ